VGFHPVHWIGTAGLIGQAFSIGSHEYSQPASPWLHKQKKKTQNISPPLKSNIHPSLRLSRKNYIENVMVCGCLQRKISVSFLVL